MGADGLATGELREPGAFRYILALTPTQGRDALGFTESAEPDPKPTAEQRAVDRAVMLRGLKYCAAYGITSLHNMDGNFYTLELLQEIDAAGDFCCRVQSPFHFKNYFGVERLKDAAEMARRFKGERVSSGRVKFFMDGVLESWTALRLTPYPDRPGHLGDPNYTAEQWNEISIEGDRLGLQLNVHAIADGAVRRTIDGYEAARKANGARDSRHRIEHIEMIHPADLPRLKALGIVASMQPTHAPGSVFPMEPGVSRMTREELGCSYGWKDVEATGAAMCFNSDWPVAPLDPMVSLAAGMNRKPYFEGARDERVSLMSLLKGYTSGGAYAEFMEHRKGKLKPGMLADVIMLSGDIEATPPEALAEMKVKLTICDGRITHEA
jgi:predicted amidohydrolase YtcJ